MAYPTNPYIYGYQQPYGGQGIIKVTGLEGARAYPMMPNSSVVLFDGNEDIFYLKTTDAANYPTLRKFSFQPVEQEPEKRADYVSRSEFDALVEKVNGLAPKNRSRKEQDGE